MVFRIYWLINCFAYWVERVEPGSWWLGNRLIMFVERFQRPQWWPRIQALALERWARRTGRPYTPGPYRVPE